MREEDDGHLRLEVSTGRPVLASYGHGPAAIGFSSREAGRPKTHEAVAMLQEVRAMEAIGRHCRRTTCGRLRASLEEAVSLTATR